jgi:ferredoxin-NADP reductase
MNSPKTETLDQVSAAGRGPLPPRFAVPVIDRVVNARPVRVLAVEAQTPTIVRLQVERPPHFQFRAGQHALLRVATERGPDLRPLSLAAPPEVDHLEFATRIGTSAFKQAIIALRPGDLVKVSRPMGGFRYDATRPAVLIAGGIGITPMRSVLLSAQAAEVTAPTRLLFSNRSIEEIPFLDELTEHARHRDNLEITWVLTSPSGAAPTGRVHNGRISEALLQQQAAELPDAVFYVAGPAAMVTDIRALLRQVGVARNRTRSVSQGYR